MSFSERIEAVYVLDTHPLIWYLTNKAKLSKYALSIFEAAVRGETQFLVSVIVMAELYYADKKWGLFEDFDAVYADLRSQPYYKFVNLTIEDVADFKRDASVSEMHDRIIAGLARRLSMPLITADKNITASGIARIAW